MNFVIRRLKKPGRWYAIVDDSGLVWTRDSRCAKDLKDALRTLIVLAGAA